MKVKILIEFEVFNLEEGDVNDVTEAVAKSAASMAAYDHLCFTENLGRSRLYALGPNRIGGVCPSGVRDCGRI